MKKTGRSLYPCVCSSHRMGTALTLNRQLSAPVFVGPTAEDYHGMSSIPGCMH